MGIVSISNFSGLFEIAFGLNAIFYCFDLIPKMDELLERKHVQHEKLRIEKIELTKNHEVFPIGFLVSCTYGPMKRFLSKVSVWVSAFMLGLLIYIGFNPTATVSGFVIWILLGIGFGVPVFGAMVHQRTCRIVDAAIAHLEDEIYEAKKRLNSESPAIKASVTAPLK